MTRIETPPPQNREELKEELLQEIKGDENRRGRWRCLGCSALFLCVILAPVIALSTVLAKTGLVNVPLLSRWFYRPESPRRVVVANPSGGGEIDAMLRQRSTVNPQTKLVTVRLTEADLTALLQKKVVGQVVIDPDALEIFTSTRQNGREITVIAIFQPTVVDKKLMLNLRRVDVGDVVVPQFISRGVIDGFLRNELATVETSVAGLGQLEQLQMSQGTLTVVFRPKKF